MDTIVKFSSTDRRATFLLKYYASKHKTAWEHYLFIRENAYNNIMNTWIGKAPFEIVDERRKVQPFFYSNDRIFWPNKYAQDQQLKPKVSLWSSSSWTYVWTSWWVLLHLFPSLLFINMNLFRFQKYML